MTASTEVVARNPQQELVSRVRSDQFQERLALALPGTVAQRHFVSAMITAINKNPDLADPAKVDVDTVFTALLRAAQDGLLPDGNEAAISIYGKKAQYLPMIGGLRKVVGEFGWQISASVVYANDEFEYEKGTTTILRHVPARGDRGGRIAAYATARHIGGGVAEPVVMWAVDVAKRRQKAQTQKVWDEWTDRMWEKTAGKAISKELPRVALDPRVQRILAADDLDYVDAAAQLYGPDTSTPALGSGDAAPPMEGNGGQQVGTADTPQGLSTADTPAPGDDDDPPPPLPAAEHDSEGRERAEAAGRVEAPKSARDWAGISIAQIHAKGDDGTAFLRWALDGKRAWAADTHKDHVFFLAARDYTAVFLPELVAS